MHSTFNSKCVANEPDVICYRVIIWSECQEIFGIGKCKIVILFSDTTIALWIKHAPNEVMWQCGIQLIELFSGIMHTYSFLTIAYCRVHSGWLGHTQVDCIVHSMLVFHSEDSNCWICEVTSHFVMSAGIWVHLTHLDQNIMMKYKLISAHNNTSDALKYDLKWNVLKRSPSYSSTECMVLGDHANRLKNENIDVIKWT